MKSITEKQKLRDFSTSKQALKATAVPGSSKHYVSIQSTRGDYSYQTRRTKNMQATWGTSWNFTLCSRRATTGSIQSRPLFLFIKCQFSITARRVAVRTFLLNARSQTASSGNAWSTSSFATSCNSALCQMRRGRRKSKLRGGFLAPVQGRHREQTQRAKRQSSSRREKPLS